MIIFDYVYKETYIIILILAFIFYIVSKTNTKILLSIIIIIILSYIAYNYILNISLNKKNNEKTINKYIEKSLEQVKQTVSKNYVVGIFPDKIKYLIKDEKLVEIIININFVRKFDKYRYADILNIADEMMKVYIFILSDRYKPEEQFSEFINLRHNILEILYSFYIILPNKFKYIYGVNPYEELKKSITDFTIHTRKMINILENYAKIEKKVYYLEDSLYRPYNKLEANLIP